MTARAPYRGASAAAIRQHYDVGNDFYSLWLDPTRTYSCALWDDDLEDTLQAAQERKLDHLARSAGAPGAARVLDIGCGWGSLLRRLVAQHGVGHVVGLTLSAAQAASIASWSGERHEVRVENWADHTPTERYDAIISIGAFEHFADYGLGRRERVAAYRTFFERCSSWLAQDGRIALQTNIKGNNVRMDRQTVRDLLFIVERNFPESELPWASELIEASERKFDVVSARNDPDHYARTCQAWLDGLRARRHEAEDIAGEEMVADYVRYLTAAVRAFEDRHLGLLRIVLERI